MSGVITFNASQTFDPAKLSNGTLPSDVSAQAYVDGSIMSDDINSAAGITLTKLGTGALPTSITVTTANIVDGSIVNTDISATAEIGRASCRERV